MRTCYTSIQHLTVKEWMRSHLCSTLSYRHGHDLVFQANSFVLAGLVGVLAFDELHDQEGEQEQATSRPWKAMHSKMQQTIEWFLLSLLGQHVRCEKRVVWMG